MKGSLGDLKVAWLTWEVSGKPKTYGDLESQNLPFAFPEWDIEYWHQRDIADGKRDPSELAEMDVVIITSAVWNDYRTDVNLQVLEMLEHPFVVVRAIGEWGKWAGSWGPDGLRRFALQLMHPNVDVIWADELSYTYLSHVTGKPVRDLGHPYPLDYVRGFRVDLDERKPIVYFARPGCLHRWATYSLVNHLPDGWLARVVLSGDEAEEEMLWTVVRRRDKVEIVETVPRWEDYLRRLAECAIMVSVDHRYTMGRFPIDAAALGIPCIGGNSHSARRLFPDLVCEPWRVDQQLEALLKLIEDFEGDRAFYSSVVERADREVVNYSIESCRKKWLDVLREFGVIG